MTSASCLPRIEQEEHLERLALLQGKLSERGIGGLLLGPTASLRYYTGLVWHISERFLGALVTPSEVIYIVPGLNRAGRKPAAFAG
jgi:Xaa-Pro dipeptidase